MSALADKPDDNDNNNNKDNIVPAFTTSLNMSDLCIEKQFTHITFCQQIQNIDLDAAKKLLIQLHMLYLSQMQVVSKIAKQDFLDSFK